MRLLKIGLCLLVLLIILPAYAQEEAPTPPLIYGSAGDIWRYEVETGTTTNITTYGYNQKPVLNQATGLVAYNSYAKIWVDTLNTGGTPSGSIPSNIWIIDPITGDAFRVIDQPANASIEERIFISRSDPTWSPDGNYLAWSEYHSNGIEQKDTYSIGIYALESQEITEFPLPDLDYYGVPGPFPVLWSPDGRFIAVIYDVMGEISTSRVIDFYDPAMTLVTEAILPDDTFSNSFLWLNELGSSKLGIYLGDAGWMTVDPTNGEILNSMVELQGEVQDTNIDRTGIFFQNDVWYMVFPAATTQVIREARSSESFDDITLDPLGEYIASVDDDSILHIMSGGQIIASLEIPDGVQGLAWSNLVWSGSMSLTPLND